MLIRTDGAGCTHEFLAWLVGQRLSYSVGFPLPADTGHLLTTIPARAWTPAHNGDGAWVAEAPGLLDLTSWPAGIRVILRKERPHPGAQLRITGGDACASPPSSTRGQLAALKLRHRRRAREDRSRVAKDTGLTKLPLHDFTQNQIWCAIVALAVELIPWLQTLALTGHPARRGEPKRLRLRLFSIAGRLTRTGRRTVLHLSRHTPWADLLTAAITTPRALPEPG